MPGKKSGVRPVAPDDSLNRETTEQAGDLQGLSDAPDADSESVRELTEEGQFFEAAAVSGVEQAREADAGPVKVRKVRVDDVPPEYTDRSPDDPKE